MNSTIGPFQGEWRFLSNFFESPIMVRSLGTTGVFTAPTAEHVFQAMKTRDLIEQQSVLECKTPGQAKHMGRNVTLRSDWEEIKLHVMRMVVQAKFEQNPELDKLLKATGDATLIELNQFNDREWGVDINTREGKNHLGKILMEVRANLK